MKRIYLSIILVSLVVLMASCLKKNQCVCYLTNSGPIGGGQPYTESKNVTTIRGTRTDAREQCKRRENLLDMGVGATATCNLEN